MGGPHLLWERIRVFASGELIDDQIYASHVETLLRKMSPANYLANADAMGWNITPQDGTYLQQTSGVKPSTQTWVGPGDAYTCTFKPLSLGLVRCGKWWPLFASSLQIELTRTTNVTDAF